jgi:hypothetical protein
MAASFLGLSLALGAGSALGQTSAGPGTWNANWPPPSVPAPPSGLVVPPPPSLPAPPGDAGSTLTFHRDALQVPGPSAGPLPSASQSSPLTFHSAALPAKSPSFLPAPSGGQGSTLTFQRPALQPTSISTPSAGPASSTIPSMVGQQQMDKNYPKGNYETTEFRSLRELPGLEVITRLESDTAFKERMRQELLRVGEHIVFPEEPVVNREPYQGRHEQPLKEWVEPNFVCHGRLLFEQQNFERGLWDLGILGPVVSVGEFCWDIALLPYHLGTRPLQQYDCSAGKCLPGDPSPFRLYPPELSLAGLTAEAAVITGLFFVFP